MKRQPYQRQTFTFPFVQTPAVTSHINSPKCFERPVQFWQALLQRLHNDDAILNAIYIGRFSMVYITFPDRKTEVARIDNIIDENNRPITSIEPGQQVAVIMAIYTKNALRKHTVCNVLLGDLYMGFTSLREPCMMHTTQGAASA